MGGDPYDTILSSGRIRVVRLEQLFPGIGGVAVEVGAIEPDTGFPNHVDMVYVVAIARHRLAAAMFEFGTYLGRTTYHLALGLPNAHVWTLDLAPEQISEGFGLRNAILAAHRLGLQGAFFKGTGCAARITQLHGDSRTFDSTPYRNRMDFVFVDGNHQYAFAQNDTRLAMEMLAPGGVILWHDFAPNAPKTAELMRFFADCTRERALFHIGKTSLLLHVDGVDPLTAELPPAPFDKRQMIAEAG